MNFLDKIFFTADTHFGHGSILRHCERPFANTYEHDRALIRNWNSVVPVDGTVYHLGDCVWDKRFGVDILSELHGTICFVKGNHDKAMKGEVLELVTNLGQYYELTVQDPDNKQLIVLCHYPLESWNKKHWGSWCLHGHSHGKTPIMKNRIDVGVDVWNYKPVSYNQIKEFFLTT